MNKMHTTILFFLMMSIICIPPITLNAQNDNSSEMTPVGPEAFEVMKQFFDYDREIPLELKIVEQLDQPGYLREKIVFKGTRYSKVPGYLAIPKSNADPYPCVLLLHGITSSKESWWEENSVMKNLTEQLLSSGFAVLSLDAEYHGERLSNNDFESPLSFIKNRWFVSSRDMMIQSTIEYRRAIDYLATRVEIDTARIGIIGYSMGGIMTFNLSAVEPRIKVSVACVTPIITVPYLPTAAHNSAPHIRQPFLLLMGTNDEKNYTKEAAGQLYHLIESGTKELKFYKSGHMLPVEWTGEAAEWMKKYLK